MTEDLLDCEPLDAGAVFGAGHGGLISFADGYFEFAGDLACASSEKKCVYRGTHVRCLGSREVRTPACAVYFWGADAGRNYARERIGLTLGGALGVGPRILEADARRSLPGADESERALALLVEEDAGVSLEAALSDGAPVPLLMGDGTWGELRLFDLADAEYERVAHKILFDVFAQAEVLQRQGLYHRDLRSANIALRAWGPGAQGIRATLIDLEFLTGKRRGRVSCEDYYDRLFGAGGLVPLDRKPTLLEQDQGYLAIVTAEVMNERPVDALDDDAVLAVLHDARSPLRVGEDGVFVRKLVLRDVWREAHLAGLSTTRAVYGHISDWAVYIADHETLHAGYVDTLDFMKLERSSEMILEQNTVECLSRAVFENYREHLRRDGKEIKYERYEDQPEDYKESCLAQARSYCDKVRLLGYELVGVRECDEARCVRQFTEEEVEFLAREEHDRWVEERTRAGWTYGPVKDEDRKVSPYLVPWSELEDDIREYDRVPVREMIGLVESAGLTVAR